MSAFVETQRVIVAAHSSRWNVLGSLLKMFSRQASLGNLVRVSQAQRHAQGRGEVAPDGFQGSLRACLEPSQRCTQLMSAIVETQRVIAAAHSSRWNVLGLRQK
jgi:hypothetical protein